MLLLKEIVQLSEMTEMSSDGKDEVLDKKLKKEKAKLEKEKAELAKEIKSRKKDKPVSDTIDRVKKYMKDNPKQAS